MKRVRVAPGAPFDLRQSSLATDRVSVERLWLTGAPAAGLTNATGVLRVAQVLRGSLVPTDGTRPASGPSPFLLPRRPYSSRWGELDRFTATLELGAVEEHARRLLGAPRLPAGLRLPPSAQPGQGPVQDGHPGPPDP